MVSGFAVGIVVLKVGILLKWLGMKTNVNVKKLMALCLMSFYDWNNKTI